LTQARSQALPEPKRIGRPTTLPRAFDGCRAVIGCGSGPVSAPLAVWRSTSTASEPCWTRGGNEAARRPDSEKLCADAGETPLREGRQAFRKSLLGPGRRKHAAHGPLTSSGMVAEVPLAGLSLDESGARRSRSPWMKRAVLRRDRISGGVSTSPRRMHASRLEAIRSGPTRFLIGA
jgi:hypothetical protein